MSRTPVINRAVPPVRLPSPQTTRAVPAVPAPSADPHRGRDPKRYSGFSGAWTIIFARRYAVMGGTFDLGLGEVYVNKINHTLTMSYGTYDLLTNHSSYNDNLRKELAMAVSARVVDVKNPASTSSLPEAVKGIEINSVEDFHAQVAALLSELNSYDFDLITDATRQDMIVRYAKMRDTLNHYRDLMAAVEGNFEAMQSKVTALVMA